MPIFETAGEYTQMFFVDRTELSFLSGSHHNHSPFSKTPLEAISNPELTNFADGFKLSLLHLSRRVKFCLEYETDCIVVCAIFTAYNMTQVTIMRNEISKLITKNRRFISIESWPSRHSLLKLNPVFVDLNFI